MKIYLAPMEGVIDYKMRQMLTRLGGYDRCVTEFIRVTSNPVPAKVFRRLCPELETGGRTDSGVPVFVQLLGGDPNLIATSAATAVKAGAPGIDLNFGCPTKIVNRHDGGSVLLQHPKRIGDIVSAVRQQIDPAVPVCAKIRLGFNNADQLADNVDQVYQAGATELCIHARTKTHGYKPPAYWSELATLTRHPATRLIVNGEIWNINDAHSALHQSGCEDLMVGRGGLAQPDLARLIRADKEEGSPAAAMPWQEIVAMVDQFYHSKDSVNTKYAGNRTKQWLAYLKRQYVGANQLFETIKGLSTPEDLAQGILAHRKSLDQADTFSRAA